MHQLLARSVASICSRRHARFTLAGQSFTGFFLDSPDANSWGRTRSPTTPQWRQETAGASIPFRSAWPARGSTARSGDRHWCRTPARYECRFCTECASRRPGESGLIAPIALRQKRVRSNDIRCATPTGALWRLDPVPARGTAFDTMQPMRPDLPGLTGPAPREAKKL